MSNVSQRIDDINMIGRCIQVSELPMLKLQMDNLAKWQKGELTIEEADKIVIGKCRSNWVNPVLAKLDEQHGTDLVNEK